LVLRRLALAGRSDGFRRIGLFLAGFSVGLNVAVLFDVGAGGNPKVAVGLAVGGFFVFVSELIVKALRRRRP